MPKTVGRAGPGVIKVEGLSLPITPLTSAALGRVAFVPLLGSNTVELALMWCERVNLKSIKTGELASPIVPHCCER